MRFNVRLMKKYIVVLPVILFLVFLAVTFLPNGFTIMSEGSDPWYTPYTSITFILLAIFFYPATFVFELLGGEPLGFTYHLVVFVYSVALSFCINKGWKFFERKNEKT